jgi:flagellar M-ring protein FliF
MAIPEEILDQIKGFVKGLSLIQKVISVVVLLVVIVALAILTFRGPQVDYRILYSSLSQEDAAAVIARLKEQRIPYSLAKEGTVIKVPSAQVHETRLLLAAEGLPRGGGVGFEILDNTSLGTTDFVQRLNYQRALSATQLEYQFKVEEVYRKKVESMLEEVVGVGRAQARVTADLDFDRVNMTQENFDPEGQVIRSEQFLTEDDSSRVESATGIPGEKGNLATITDAGEQGAPSGEKRQRNNVTRNYEITKVTRQVQAATGAIKRLSVAVMVDGVYEKQVSADGSSIMKYKPRSPEELNNFDRIVRNAIGYNEDRGDQVEVVGVPFALSRITEPVPSALEKWETQVDKLVIPLIVLMIAVAFILFVIRLFFRMLAEKRRKTEETLQRSVEKGQLLTPEEEEDLSLAPKKMTDKERVYKLAQSDPDRAVDLVRRWLREER